MQDKAFLFVLIGRGLEDRLYQNVLLKQETRHKPVFFIYLQTLTSRMRGSTKLYWSCSLGSNSK